MLSTLIVDSRSRLILNIHNIYLSRYIYIYTIYIYIYIHTHTYIYIYHVHFDSIYRSRSSIPPKKWPPGIAASDPRIGTYCGYSALSLAAAGAKVGRLFLGSWAQEWSQSMWLQDVNTYIYYIYVCVIIWICYNFPVARCNSKQF